MSTRVSMFVPTYNASEFLRDCLDSLVGQTHPLYEIVVCDDASSDGTQEIINEYASRHPNLIKPLLHPENLGAVKNFNSGLAALTGDYFSLCAGDDYWAKDKIENELKALQSKPNARWAYSDSASHFQDTGRTESFRRKYDGREGDILFPILTHQMTLRNWLAEASLVREVGWFDDQLRTYEDWDFKIRLASLAEVAHCPHETVFYRRRKDGLSSIHNIKSEFLARIHDKNRGLLERLSEEQTNEILELWEKKLSRNQPTLINQLKNLARRITRSLKS